MKGARNTKLRRRAKGKTRARGLLTNPTRGRKATWRAAGIERQASRVNTRTGSRTPRPVAKAAPAALRKDGEETQPHLQLRRAQYQRRLFPRDQCRRRFRLRFRPGPQSSARSLPRPARPRFRRQGYLSSFHRQSRHRQDLLRACSGFQSPLTYTAPISLAHSTGPSVATCALT
jgi:hypothetical protein